MTWADEVKDHRDALTTGFAVFGRSPHSALLWMTVVIAAHVVTLEDEIAPVIAADLDAFRMDRPSVLKKGGKTYRNPAGWTRYAGGIEIDLIHPRIARMCSQTKTGLLAELGIDVTALRDDERIMVVHEHAVVDHRGHPSADALVRDVRAAWPGPRRVHAARLYTEGTVAENLRNLSKYTGKFRSRYSWAWNGRRTSFLCNIEDNWSDYLRRTYQAIGFARLFDSNVSTQAGKREMHTGGAVSRAETPSSDALQLMFPQTMKDEGHDHTKHSTLHNHHLRSSGDHAAIMKANEIIDHYVDPERIAADDLNDLRDALAREGEGLSSDELCLMYSDVEADLRVEQQRLAILKTRAEIDRLEAQAARDRADAAAARSKIMAANEARSIRSRSRGGPAGSPG